MGTLRLLVICSALALCPLSVAAETGGSGEGVLLPPSSYAALSPEGPSTGASPDGRDTAFDNASATPTTSIAASAAALEVVYLTNQERAKAGLPPLKAEVRLETAAFGHSTDMAVNDFFNHIGSNGAELPARLAAVGYTGWTAGGENVGAGFSTAASVVAAWMNSPGHRNNILNANYREIGVALVYQAGDQANVRLPDGSLGGPYYYYWTQDFGARYGAYPVIINGEAATTSDPNVTLAILGAGWASQVMISNDSAFAGATWQPFCAQMAWRLAAGNGVRTVYVKLRNSYGQEVVSTDSIELTGQAPNPCECPVSPMTVSVNSGQAQTNSSTVQLAFQYPASAQYLEVSKTSSFTAAVRLSPQPSATWQLDSAQPGLQNVYVRYGDGCGRTSPTASDSILFDPLPPIGSVRISADLGRVVQVSLDAWDPLSGVAAMAVGFDAGSLFWQDFRPTLQLTVPDGAQAAGTARIVYARFRDAAGNISQLCRSDDTRGGVIRVFLPVASSGK